MRKNRKILILLAILALAGCTRSLPPVGRLDHDLLSGSSALFVQEDNVTKVYITCHGKCKIYKKEVKK